MQYRIIQWCENMPAELIPIAELPAGTDESDLYADQNERTVIIPYKNKKWEFIVRELTWAEHQTIASKMARMRVGGSGAADATVDVLEGNITYLTKAIIKAPFPVNRATFLRLDKDFGRLLVAYIIEGKTDGSDEKNSEQPSEVET